MLIAIAGSQGCGKAQPHGSKVLTPSGWVSIETLVVGDQVITPDNKTSAVTGVFPQGVKPVFMVTAHDGATTRACEDHLWKIHRSKQTKVKGKSTYTKVTDVVSTATLAKLVDKVRSNRQDPNKSNWGANVSIPVNQPIDFRVTDNKLCVPPYVLGAFLGDGCLTQQQPQFTSVDKEIVDNINILLRASFNQELSHKTKASEIEFIVKSNTPCKHTNVFRDALKNVGVWGEYSHNKHIPDDYKHAPITDRISLIQGLMDTDGTVTKTGHMSISTSSSTMASDIQYVIRSLGGTSTISVKHPFYKHRGVKTYGRPNYTVSISHPTPHIFVSLTRKKQLATRSYFDGHKNGEIGFHRRITGVVPDGVGECVCIAIDHPDRLYITDDFIVTHNTTVINHLKEKGFKTVERKTSRSILEDWNVSLSEVNNNADLTIKFQDEIIRRKMADENAACAHPGDIVITERTFSDLFVYGNISLGMHNEHSDYVNSYYNTCLHANQKYDLVFYLTAGHFAPVHDGVRGSNLHYSRMVDLTMRDCITRMVLPDRLVMVDASTVNDRVAFISTMIASKKNQMQKNM